MLLLVALACKGAVCREEANLGEVIYPRGSISGLPEAHASRKERFAELEDLQQGWEVELRGRKGGTTVDAFFFSPTGVMSADVYTLDKASLL